MGVYLSILIRCNLTNKSDGSVWSHHLVQDGDKRRGLVNTELTFGSHALQVTSRLAKELLASQEDDRIL
jgi:hypothetical protein